MSRMIHLLEFGTISHNNLSMISTEVKYQDLNNLTKYLQAMPVSTKILEDRQTLSLRDFEDQGKIGSLLFAAFGLMIIFIGAYSIVAIQEKNSEK